MWKTNSLKKKQKCSNFLSKRGIAFLALESGQISTIVKKNLGNVKEIADFIQKNAKFRDIKMLKTNPSLLENMHCPFIKA